MGWKWLNLLSAVFQPWKGGANADVELTVWEFSTLWNLYKWHNDNGHLPTRHVNFQIYIYGKRQF